MKLKVRFEYITKEVNWWRNVDDFPKLINFMGKNHKYIGARLDTNNNKDELVFSPTSSWDPEHTVVCSTWLDLFPEIPTGCECGAAYTSFPKHHMFFCRLWTKN